MITPLAKSDLPELAELLKTEAGPELRYMDEGDPEVIRSVWEGLIDQGLSLSVVYRDAEHTLQGWVLGFASYDLFSGRPIAVILFWYVRKPRTLGRQLSAIGLMERFIDRARLHGCTRVLGGEWETGPSLGRTLNRLGFRRTEISYHKDL